MISRIGYKEVFNKPVEEGIIKKIELEPALEFLSAINKFEYKIHDERSSDLKFICNDWLVRSDQNLKDKILKSYNRILKNNTHFRKPAGDVRIINKAATLRAMERLLSYYSDDFDNNKNISYNDEESLFKLYLSVNDELNGRQENMFRKYLDFKNENKTVRLHLYLGINQYILNQEALPKKIWAEALKFVLFEKWIKNQNKYSHLIENYLNRFGVKDWYGLFNIIFQINSIAIHNHKFKVEENDNSLKFLEFISEHKENSPDWREYSEIRKKPLYKLSNGDFLILDFSFLLDKFFSGIYYDILGQSNESSFKSFHQDYSLDFVEKFLLSNALNAVFGNSYLKFDENKIKELGSKGIENLSLPDYYIRNGNKIFLFECKNSFISHKSKMDLDCDMVEQEIKEKFYWSGKKKKAVKQLLNYIELSQNEKYNFFDDKIKLRRCTYYPILVTTDLTLTSLGINKLLNEYMSEDLKDIDADLKRRIKPLTIIHINDFLVRTNKLKKLDLLIDNYLKHCNTQKATDDMISFSDYLDLFKFRNRESFDYKSFKEMIRGSDSLSE